MEKISSRYTFRLKKGGREAGEKKERERVRVVERR